MKHQNDNTEGPMSILALVSSGPLRRTVQVRGALTYRRERDISLQVPGWLDFRYRSVPYLDLDAAVELDLAGAISPESIRRMAAAAKRTDGFQFIELGPEDAGPFAYTLAKRTPARFGPALPIFDPYEPRNGLLVPVATIRNQLTPLAKENKTMTHFLERAAPHAFRVIKQLIDDPDNVIAEFILFEFAKRQGDCKWLDRVKGNKPRDKNLTNVEIEALAKPFATEIGRRNVSEVREPLVNPLPDTPFGLVPLLGQRNDANVIFFAAFIGTNAARLGLDIDEALPGVSDALLEGLALKPKNNAA